MADHPLENCFSDACGNADQMFGKLAKVQRLNPRHPDKPARQNSADALNIPRRRALAAEGQDAFINSPLIGAGINEIANSTVGKGRRLKPEFNAKRLGWTAEQYTEVVNEVKCLWREDMESKRKWIDQEGNKTLAEMQRMVLEQTLSVGECYTLGFWFNNPERPFRTSLAIIDQDRVRTPSHISQEDNNRTIAGHLKSPSGRTANYFVHDWHRNDPRNTESPEPYTAVRRYNEFGREQVIHTYIQKLPGLTRGLSALTSAFSDLKCFEKYKKVQMEAAILQTAMAFVVTSDDKNILSQISGNGIDNEKLAKNLYAKGLEKAVQSQELLNTNGLNFDGAKAIRLLDSEKADIVTASQAGVNDSTFVENCMTPIARSLGLSPNTLTQNFEASFSASRATLLSFYRQCENYGHYIIDDWLTSVYAMWLEDVIESGRLSIPSFADPTEAWLHFTGNREWYCNAQFSGPARDEIDQAKMMTFWREVKNLGAFTFQKFHDSRGDDWQEIIIQQFEEMQFIDNKIETCPLKHIDPIAFMQGKLDAVIVEPPQQAEQT